MKKKPSVTPTVQPTGSEEPAVSPAPEATVPPINEEPIFTLKEYPKVDASLAIHPLVDSIAADFLGMKESELEFEYMPL